LAQLIAADINTAGAGQDAEEAHHAQGAA
jgi:hypothetical protein